MQLPALRHSPGPPITIDGSRSQYRNQYYPRVSEFLQALPMVKVDPISGIQPQVTGKPFGLGFDLDFPQAFSAAVGYYDNNTDIGQLTGDPALTQRFPIVFAQLGLRFEYPRIDGIVTMPGTAGDGAERQMYASISATLAALDTALVRGAFDPAETPTELLGLAQLAETTSREMAAGNDLDFDIADLVTRITPSGMAAGEGVQCLVTGVKGHRRLQMTTAGMQGNSGWRVDKRTGLTVFHYRGLPVYRADVDEATTSTIFAVNMGGTGINLLHAVGTAETFGLVCDEEPMTTTRANSKYVVHGAFALVPWEISANFALTGVELPPVP